MSQHIRVADRFKKQTAEQLVTMAGAVISGLTGNPAFPAPTVDLKAVQAAADALKTALVAQAQGGTAATADKNNKQEALVVLLRKVKHYVEDNCAGDPAVILTGYRNLGLDDQSNGLPRRDHGLWNQDTFFKSGTHFLRI